MRARSRTLYSALILAVIASGLASRQYPELLSPPFGKYPGDVLWALMVFLLIGFAKPRWSIARTAAAALLVSFAVEFSQIYQAPWIEAIRQNTIGHLVLGSEFHVEDLLAYAVGIAAGAAAEALALLKARRRSSIPSGPGKGRRE